VRLVVNCNIHTVLVTSLYSDCTGGEYPQLPDPRWMSGCFVVEKGGNQETKKERDGDEL